MENKRYLDKVLGHMVKGTKIDYKGETMVFPFTTNPTRFSTTTPHVLSFLLFPFIEYCKRHFGLTSDEVDYVYLRYLEIIKNKIKNEQ